MTKLILIGLFCIAQSPGNDGPTVRVTDLSGSTHEIKDARFSADWKLIGVRGERALTIDARELLAVDFGGKQVQPDGARVLFPTGEVLYGEVTSADVENLTVRSDRHRDVEVPLTCVSGVVLASDANRQRSDQLSKLLQDGSRRSDVVLLRNGDVLSGAFAGVENRDLLLERDGKVVKLNRSLVFAVVFDPSLLDYEVPTEFYALVRLLNGAELAVTSLRTMEGRLQLTTALGPEVSVAAAEVVGMEFRNGKVVYLSDLTPNSNRHEPFLDDKQPFQKDLCVLGSPLQLKGRTYSKGLGVRSRSVLEFKLDSSFERFQSLVGLDDRAGAHASVKFLVHGDGKKIFASDELVSTSEPVEIDVDVAGVKMLTLTVDYANRGDVQDYADWAAARLLR